MCTLQNGMTEDKHVTNTLWLHGLKSCLINHSHAILYVDMYIHILSQSLRTCSWSKVIAIGLPTWDYKWSHWVFNTYFSGKEHHFGVGPMMALISYIFPVRNRWWCKNLFGPTGLLFCSEGRLHTHTPSKHHFVGKIMWRFLKWWRL